MPVGPVAVHATLRRIRDRVERMKRALDLLAAQAVRDHHHPGAPVFVRPSVQVGGRVNEVPDAVHEHRAGDPRHVQQPLDPQHPIPVAVQQHRHPHPERGPVQCRLEGEAAGGDARGMRSVAARQVQIAAISRERGRLACKTVATHRGAGRRRPWDPDRGCPPGSDRGRLPGVSHRVPEADRHDPSGRRPRPWPPGSSASSAPPRGPSTAGRRRR